MSDEKGKKTKFTPKEILQMEPNLMLTWIQKEFLFEVPETLESVEDLKYAQNMLTKIANYNTYLSVILAYAKTSTRYLKAEAEANKYNQEKIREYEQMISRRDALQTVVDILKLQYQAISRAFTIRQEAAKELYMTGDFPEEYNKKSYNQQNSFRQNKRIV